VSGISSFSLSLLFFVDCQFFSCLFLIVSLILIIFNLRRATRLKAADDLLVVQTRKLYEVQKEFFSLLPRIHSDVQLTILKSIVGELFLYSPIPFLTSFFLSLFLPLETQSQLVKLTEGIDRMQSTNHSICSRMKTQLTNAASSLVQMIREENNLIFQEITTTTTTGITASTTSVESSLALQIMKQRMIDSGVKGFELSLQKVLEGLMIQSQTRELVTGTGASQKKLPSASSAPSSPHKENNNNNNNNQNNNNNNPVQPTSSSQFHSAGGDLSSLKVFEDQGKIDMTSEAAALLATSNPAILPELPRSFAHSIGMETCVWFNAFLGRVYRDVATSDYFYHWFCSKLALMLNKKGKDRPSYIDKFEVNEVTFGELPPLLMNVKWSPQLKKRDKDHDKDKEKLNPSLKKNQAGDTNKKTNRTGASYDAEDGEEEEDDEDEEEDDDEDDNEFGEEEEDEKIPIPIGVGMDPLGMGSGGNGHEEHQFFAGCTADMAFRSGIKFTVSTK
jgi:hypothetical protein